MGGNGNWSPETDDFILRNVLYLLYGADKTKGNKAYKSPGILKNPQKTDCFKKIDNYQDFFNLHFAGYLSEVKKGASYLICDVETGSYSDMSLLTKTRRDLLTGIQKYSGKGSKVRKALMDKIEALSSNKSGLQHYVNGINYEAEFSQVIDEIEYANYCILKAWDLNLGETVAKLNVFMERMEAGESKENTKLIPFPSEMRTEIFTLIRTQITKAENASDPWESVATVITWLLLLSLFRGEAGKIAAYYGKMGEQHVTNCNKEKIAEFVNRQMGITPDDSSLTKNGSRTTALLSDPSGSKTTGKSTGKSTDKSTCRSVGKLTDKSMNESTSGLCSDTHKKTDSPRIRISRYAPPTEIRPFTMEEVGNLRNTYVERTDILEILDQIFWGDSQDEKRYVFLSGMGGDGKSELARAYAYHHQMDYDDIFWLTCQDGKTPELDQLLKDNSYTINPSDRKILNSHTLLIVDNCNEIPTPFLRQLCYETGQAHLLITTRLKEISVENKHILPVFADEGQILLPGNFGFSYSNFDHPETSVHAEASVQAEKITSVGTAAQTEEITQTEEAAQTEEITQAEKIAQAKKNIMTQEDFAYQIFYRNYFANFPDAKEIEKQLVDSERENIRKICRRMGNHPMITAMVAVMLRENQDDYSIEEFEEISRRNLSEAIPSYLSIPFGQNGKDCEEEPLELLRKLFVSSSMREFSLYEKQLLNLLQLVPARQMNIPYICELLGDTKFNRAIKNAYDKLQRLHLIQSNGTWMSIHPLVSEALKLEPEKIQLENRELFFQKVLESWLSGDLQNFDDCLMYYVWNQSGIKEEKSNFNLAVCSILLKEDAKVLFTQLNPEVNMVFTAFVDSENTRTFLYYDLEQRKEISFYNCGKQKNNMKKTKYQTQSINNKVKQKYISEVVLLYLILKNTSGSLEFPDEVLGCPITEIPDFFCRQYDNITDLRLPDKLERIGDYAFECCTGIHKLNLPENLKEIGKAAFLRCKSLKGDLIIPDKIIKIHKETFAECEQLDGKLIIGKNVEEIDDAAFLSCNLKGTIQFNEKLQRIGKGAFTANCFLEEIILNEGLEIIDERAFCFCQSLKNKLHLPATLEKIERAAFLWCENLSGKIVIPKKVEYIKDLTFACCIKISDLELHENIKSIGKSAFFGCMGLKSNIKLPDALKTLGNNAFGKCTHLKEIIFNSTLKRIEKATFSGCNELKYVELPEKLEFIGEDAFNKCFSLTQISDFPDTLKEIDARAFFLCKNLKMNIHFSAQLQKIGKFAFAGCRQLYGEIIFGDNLEEIGEYAFFKCIRLTGDLHLPETLQHISKTSFKGCENLNEQKKANLSNSKIINKLNDQGEFILDKTVTTIEGSWIRKTYGDLPQTIIIPDQITRLNDKAFYKFKLKHVRLSANLEEIGEMAFAQCSTLTTISEFSPSLKKIQKWSFEGCGNLKMQLKLPPSLEEIGIGAFSHCAKLHGKVVFSKKMTQISENAFEHCISLNELVFPSGIKKIKDHAFTACEGLHKIHFTEGLQEIGSSAFSCCTNIEDIIFPAGLKKIGKEAFSQCYNLKNIAFSEGLEIIEKEAFYNAGLVTGTLKFPSTLKEIHESAFEGCVHLIGGDLILPENVEKVSNNAFDLCDFSNIVFKNQYTFIGEKALGHTTAVIWGYWNSTAYDYAKKYGHKFCDIRDWPDC